MRGGGCSAFARLARRAHAAAAARARRCRGLAAGGDRHQPRRRRRRVVDALVAAGVEGIVVAGTGNGSVHQRAAAGRRAAPSHAGVPVLRASRCLLGGVVGAPADALAAAGALTPAQARIELMLRPAARRARSAQTTSASRRCCRAWRSSTGRPRAPSSTSASAAARSMPGTVIAIATCDAEGARLAGHRADGHVGRDRHLGRQRDLLHARHGLHRADEAGRVAGREQLLGVGAGAAVAAQFLRRGQRAA